MFTIFAGLFSGLTKYLVIAGVVVSIVTGAFFYGMHVASSSCHASELAAELKVQKQQAIELQKQLADAQSMIAAYNDHKTKSDQQVKVIIKKIPVYNKSCDIPKSVIDLINQERK